MEAKNTLTIELESTGEKFEAPKQLIEISEHLKEMPGIEECDSVKLDL
jgi:hypothetical protein